MGLDDSSHIPSPFWGSEPTEQTWKELGGAPVTLGWEEALPGSGLGSNLSFFIASSGVLGKILRLSQLQFPHLENNV